MSAKPRPLLQAVPDGPEAAGTSPEPLAAVAEPCARCGGSGRLRLGAQRHCTCLDCLGQGRRPLRPAATTVADVMADVLQLDDRQRLPDLSAAASSAVAR